MFTNRMFYVLVAVILLVVTFFAFQQAASAGAITRANRSDAQAIQWQDAILRSHRGGMNPQLPLNVQPMMAAVPSGAIADRSYDAIEDLRAQSASR